ncbi:hypothetical protein AB0J74_03630 [Asanoa sp. NPDC049573]|uniref:hypothetical protein n=1 Tax=Asanoa sp. NPDC049573 TaxID=3155396 RepID=UPI0034181BA3
MSDDYRDPSGNTEAFRAFASDDTASTPGATPAPAANRMPLIIGGAVLAVVVIVVLVLAL